MFIDSRPGTLVEPLTGRRWSPAATIAEAHRRAAAYGALGVGAGDRVFLLSGNRLEFFAELLAVWSLGACAVPVDSRLTAFELGTLAAAARPRLSLSAEPPAPAVLDALAAAGTIALAADEGLAGQPAEGFRSARVLLDADALILFTSGTTGQPKGVVHTHRSLRARWMDLRAALGVGAFQRTLCLLPTHFGHGLICNCLYPWLSGCDLYVLPPFRPDLAMQLGDVIDEHAITFLSSVPPVWHLALKASRPPGRGSLRRVFCGSAPLSAHLWTRIRDWTGAPEVCNAYGITETGSWVAGTTVGAFTPEDGLIGVGWGSVVKVLASNSTDQGPGLADECAQGRSGFVWLNTAALMKGYLGRDDLTARVVTGGWFLTGDVGLVDDRGWLYLQGREREEINKGGMKIYPGDIDAVVERYEGAADVCAFPCDHPLYGQDVAMAVVLCGDDPAVVRGLHAWMRQRLAEHQMPQRWYVVPEIPRTSRGKVNRDHVREACARLTPLNLRDALGPPGGRG
jgi:long-chain acyl-CoA synthetase